MHVNYTSIKLIKMSETWGVLQGTTVLFGIWAPESIIILESFPTCVQMCVKVTEGCVCILGGHLRQQLREMGISCILFIRWWGGGGCGRACDHGVNKTAPFLWWCHSSEVPGWEYSSPWVLKAHSLNHSLWLGWQQHFIVRNLTLKCYQPIETIFQMTYQRHCR